MALESNIALKMANESEGRKATCSHIFLLMSVVPAASFLVTTPKQTKSATSTTGEPDKLSQKKV